MSKLSIKKVKEAIKGSKGIISVIAKRCEVTRLAIYKYIEKHPKLKEEIQEEREKLVDIAELGLLTKLNEGENWAIAMVLKTLGKNRGYSEKLEIDTKNTGNIVWTEKKIFDKYFGEKKEE